MEPNKQFSNFRKNLDINSNNYNYQKNNVNNNSNKSVFNVNAIITNLKKSLENFDSSIKELKLNIDKDKEEKDRKIKELEETFNSKINLIKNSQEYDNQRNQVSYRNKKSNEFYISPENFNELVLRINNLEQKSEKLELNMKNELYNLNNKNNVFSSRTYKRDTDSPLCKNIDNLVNQKVEEVIDRKMKILDEKLQILNNKVINLEVKSQNKINEKNDNSKFNETFVSKKFKAINNKINDRIFRLMNKLGIEDYEDVFSNNSEENNDDDENYGEIDDNYNNINELELKLMDEIKNKMKMIYEDINNRIRDNIEKKFNDIKNDISILMNKLDDNINNKISLMRTELVKMVETKNNYFDDKIKNIGNKTNKSLTNNQTCLDKISLLESKIKTIDNKFRVVDNKFENILNDSYITNSSPNIRNRLIENSEGKNININLSFNIDKTLDLDSNILAKEYMKEDFFVFSKIKETFPYNMTIIYKLVYRASKDGDTSYNFHNKCDYIGPNMVLIKTKKNFIFGGVTSKSWKHLLKDIKKDEPEYGTEIKDEKAFGFSVNLKKIYINGKPDEFAIFCNNQYGPVFKNNFFAIFNKCLKNGGICGKIEESNFIGQEKDYEFNGEEEKFEIEDIEVFQIGFK
jgi:hypothetical protein